jgi:hypothetical protein
MVSSIIQRAAYINLTASGTPQMIGGRAMSRPQRGASRRFGRGKFVFPSCGAPASARARRPASSSPVLRPGQAAISGETGVLRALEAALCERGASQLAPAAAIAYLLGPFWGQSDLSIGLQNDPWS